MAIVLKSSTLKKRIFKWINWENARRKPWTDYLYLIVLKAKIKPNLLKHDVLKSNFLWKYKHEKFPNWIKKVKNNQIWKIYWISSNEREQKQKASKSILTNSLKKLVKFTLKCKFFKNVQ